MVKVFYPQLDMKKVRGYVATFLPLLAFCLQFFWAAQAFAAAPRIENGVLDLRNWNFETDGIVELNGSWEFFWQEFQVTAPNQTDGQTPQYLDPEYLDLPGTWLGKVHGGEILGANGFATLRLKVLLGENPANLGLRLKRGQTAFCLFIDGEEVLNAGQIGRSYKEESPWRTRQIATVRDAQGEIELTIQISNFSSFNGGGFLSPITLGEAGYQANQHLSEYTWDIVLTGIYVCLGVFILILHIGKRRRDAAYFILYLIAFGTALHLLTVNATLVELFPHVPWFWNERPAFVTAAMVIVLIYEFVRQVYPQHLSVRVSGGLAITAFALSVFIVGWPGPLRSEVPVVLALLTVVALVAGSLGLYKVVREGVSGVGPIVGGTIILILSGLNDLLMMAGLISSTYIVPYGILAMLLLFAFKLSVKVSMAFSKNELLAAAIEPSTESIVVYDEKDQLIFWNKASLTYIGETFQDYFKVGMNYEDLVRAQAYSGEFPGQEEAYIRGRMKEHSNPGPAYEVYRHGRWYLYRESRTPDGGSISVMTDISVQREREGKLQLALSELDKANNSKTEFLANMSHELRTPLNAILGFSEIMNMPELDLSHERKVEYPSLIHTAALQLLKLVNDILDLTRIESGKIVLCLEHVDLEDILKNCFLLVKSEAAGAGVNMSYHVQPHLPKLYADPIRLQQIITILLDNAIKFTDLDGEIEVRAFLDEANGVSIQVSDTGIGIAEENLDRVLEKFSQVRESHMKTHDGLGLGLAIAEQLMLQHGGEIEIRSVLGSGTVVVAKFPEAQEVALRA